MNPFNIKTLYLLALTISIFSCSKDDDDSVNEISAKRYFVDSVLVQNDSGIWEKRIQSSEEYLLVNSSSGYHTITSVDTEKETTKLVTLSISADKVEVKYSDTSKVYSREVNSTKNEIWSNPKERVYVFNGIQKILQDPLVYNIKKVFENGTEKSVNQRIVILLQNSQLGFHEIGDGIAIKIRNFTIDPTVISYRPNSNISFTRQNTGSSQEKWLIRPGLTDYWIVNK